VPAPNRQSELAGTHLLRETPVQALGQPDGEQYDQFWSTSVELRDSGHSEAVSLAALPIPDTMKLLHAELRARGLFPTEVSCRIG
jgi:hypothetical protein